MDEPVVPLVELSTFPNFFIYKAQRVKLLGLDVDEHLSQATNINHSLNPPY